MGKLGGLLGQPCFPWSRQAAASFPTCPVQRVPAPLQKGGSSLPLMCAPSSELRTSAFDLMGEGVRARGCNGERWHTEEIAPFSGDCRGAHQQVNNTPPHGSIIEIHCGNRRITRVTSTCEIHSRCARSVASAKGCATNLVFEFAMDGLRFVRVVRV